MRVLLSAYACEPGVGSEPGIGWRWAIELARLGHEVTVVTPPTKRIEIEAELKKLPGINISFIFYKPPGIFLWANWYKLWPFNIGHRAYWFMWEHIHHFVWQYGAFHTIKKIHQHNPFDIVHHITYGVARRASFMGYLKGVWFIFGPLGGGERSPWKLRSKLTWVASIIETVRDLSILGAKLNPFLWSTFKKADVIYLKTAESAFLVPDKFKNKIKISLEIGREASIDSNKIHKHKNTSDSIFRVLFVGRFLYWKGMTYGLHAFAKLAKSDPDVRLVIIGEGPLEHNWHDLAKSLSIEHLIEWVPWINRDELKVYYESADIFLFPSLHDSSGNVILESLSNGLPVVCFDLGGPATIVNETCAKICSTKGKDSSAVIEELYVAMKSLSQDRENLNKMKTAAIKHSAKYVWSEVVSEFYHDATTNLPCNKSE